MAIYDYNGTATTEIGKVYDYNGTASTQIGKVYDYNGTASSLIYSSETNAFTDLGGFGNVSVGYMYTGYPSFGSSISFSTESSSYPNSFFGSIIWSNNKVDVSSGGTISLTLSSALKMSVVDTNLAVGAGYLGWLSIVLSSTRTSISEVIDVKSKVANAAAAIYDTVSVRKTWYGTAQSGVANAGTYTSTINVTGSYYLGVFLNGYDGRLSSAFNISQIIIT